jgi:hypothetical protein
MVADSIVDYHHWCGELKVKGAVDASKKKAVGSGSLGV